MRPAAQPVVWSTRPAPRRPDQSARRRRRRERGGGLGDTGSASCALLVGAAAVLLAGGSAFTAARRAGRPVTAPDRPARCHGTGERSRRAPEPCLGGGAGAPAARGHAPACPAPLLTGATARARRGSSRRRTKHRIILGVVCPGVRCAVDRRHRPSPGPSEHILDARLRVVKQLVAAATSPEHAATRRSRDLPGTRTPAPPARRGGWPRTSRTSGSPSKVMRGTTTSASRWASKVSALLLHIARDVDPKNLRASETRFKVAPLIQAAPRWPLRRAGWTRLRCANSTRCRTHVVRPGSNEARACFAAQLHAISGYVDAAARCRRVMPDMLGSEVTTFATSSVSRILRNARHRRLARCFRDRCASTTER